MQNTPETSEQEQPSAQQESRLQRLRDSVWMAARGGGWEREGFGRLPNVETDAGRTLLF